MSDASTGWEIGQADAAARAAADLQEGLETEHRLTLVTAALEYVDVSCSCGWAFRQQEDGDHGEANLREMIRDHPQSL